MFDSKDELFLKDLLTLYTFLPETNMYMVPGLTPDFSALETCPCCGSEEEEFEVKAHAPDNFPYFSEEFAPVFQDINGIIQRDNFRARMEDYPSTKVSRQIESVINNHDTPYYSEQAYEKYRRLINHFDKSPYFSKKLLEESYHGGFKTPPFPAGMNLRTYYCDTCYEDVFVALRFPMVNDRELTQGQKKHVLSVVPHETKVYMYTMIARAVAFTYCFSIHNEYISPLDFEREVSKPYAFGAFQSVLFPHHKL